MSLLNRLLGIPLFQDIDRAFGEGYAAGRKAVSSPEPLENPYGSDRDYLGWAWMTGWRMATMYSQDKRDEAEFAKVREQREILTQDNKDLIERIDMATQRAQQDGVTIQALEERIDQQSSLIHSLSQMLKTFQMNDHS